MSDLKAISIPESVFLSAQTLDELEDWLASNNPDFIADIRRIRNGEDIAGKGKDLSEIVKRWPVKS